MLLFWNKCIILFWEWSWLYSIR